VSRGLGKTQRAILATLADTSAGNFWPVRDLIEALHDGYPPGVDDIHRPGYIANYYAKASGIRRALHGLEHRGLADGSHYQPHVQGQPKGWRITEAGRAALKESQS
jgi:hypothetical protein